MAMILGQMTGPISGNITTLNAIPLADPRRIEVNLGFHAGRLSNGYQILFLKTLPSVDDFEFDGTTLRSGGRDGLPAKTVADDRLRPRVHEGVLRDRGASGYQALQVNALRSAQVTGPNRLVRIQPVTPHNAAMDVDAQYPMGGGFLQWRIKRPGLQCLFAAEVDGAGKATTRSETFLLNSGHFLTDLPARTRFQNFLQRA